MRRRTSPGIRVAVATAVAVALLPAAPHAQEAEEAASGSASASPSREALFEGDELGRRVKDGFAVGFDALILRPIGAIKTGLGLALFMPASLLSLNEGREATEEAWDLLVGRPARETFQRPLGDFS